MSKNEVVDVVIPILPARTKVTVLKVIIPPLTEEQKLPWVIPNELLRYECIDCSFCTLLVDEMLEHQKHPNITHKIKRLLKGK